MLIILSTHPIQYQVPIWKALAAAARVPFEVWYLTRHGVAPSRDSEFGQSFSWDIDMLSGYPHRFIDGGAKATPVDFLRCRLGENFREQLHGCGATAVWIQGWQVRAYWQAVREAHAARCEVWLRGESNDLGPAPLWKRPFKRALLSWLFRRVDRFLYIGSANKRLYRSFGVPEVKLYRAPYMVDNERFARQANALRGKHAELRRAWGIPDDAFCVLFCGKFIAKKRPQDLIAAAQALRSSGRLPNLHLLFVGAGELGDALREQCAIAFDAERGGLANAAAMNGKPPASFAGFLNQTEISKAYVAADCLVLPSDAGETWGLVVNEALASGLECLVSEACGCAEDLVPKSFTFPVGDVAALAGRVVALRRGELHRAPGQLPSVEDNVEAVHQAYRDLQAHQ